MLGALPAAFPFVFFFLCLCCCCFWCSSCCRCCCCSACLAMASKLDAGVVQMESTDWAWRCSDLQRTFGRFLGTPSLFARFKSVVSFSFSFSFSAALPARKVAAFAFSSSASCMVWCFVVVEMRKVFSNQFFFFFFFLSFFLNLSPTFLSTFLLCPIAPLVPLLLLDSMALQ